jgi:thioredoxin reductase
MIDVAIIGAGPYGLSIAAHLKERGLEFRVFGRPMHTWLEQMPAGMQLKSEGFASSLSDPDSSFTLKQYCKQHSLPYADVGLPVPLDRFTAYGLAFQQKFVPNLEDKLVVSVRPSSRGFELLLEDGESVIARKVVVAVGITHFGHTPDVLKGLPDDLASHSSRYGRLEQFEGQSVIVVGAGASALDLAALLHGNRAHVQLVARTPVIRFHEPPGEPWRFRVSARHLKKGLGVAWSNLRHPRSGLGVGWDTWLSAHAALAIHYLPEQTRLKIVRETLGPAPGWFIKDAVVGKVAFTLGARIANATARKGQVDLQIVDVTGRTQTLVADHVIAATGYRVNLERLDFLSPETRGRIRTIEQAPSLSAHFESSLEGLYFVGPSSAPSFGPLPRFAYGARFSARRVVRHLIGTASVARATIAVPRIQQLGAGRQVE